MVKPTTFGQNAFFCYSPNHHMEGMNMTNAFSYSCRDCEGMEACPGSVVAATKEEVWKLMELHAQIAHDENSEDWDRETRDYLGTLIKPVSV
jgi:hypothetical protein